MKMMKALPAMALLTLAAMPAQSKTAAENSAASSQAGSSHKVQQFYLVRHAEKSSEGKDPPLSACGEAQAAALAELLSQVSLQQLYHSNYQRTRQTAAALQQHGQPLLAYDPKDLKQLAEHLLHSHESAVLVAGHSNTTPELATLLSGLQVPAMTEQDYGRVYQLTRFGQGEKSVWAFQLLQLPKPTACR